MSAIKKVLRVQKVRELQRLAELGHVNKVVVEEKQKLSQLSRFLSEYTVDKKLVGRKVNVEELKNQNRFVGTIVHAHHEQLSKLNKLTSITMTKQSEFKSAKLFSNSLQERVRNEEKRLRAQHQIKEDAESSDIFNFRVQE